MKKKMVTLLLATTLLASTLSGCASTGKEESAAAKQTSEASVEKTEVASSVVEEVEAIPNFNAEGYPIVDEEITLKVLMRIRDVDAVTEPEDMPALQKLEELTGIHAEYEFVKQSEWTTKLNLMLATGEYPDVIYDGGGVNVEDHCVDQGIFIPLDDLIEEYMPTYVERRDAAPVDVTRKFPASDGKTYTLGYKIGGDYTMGCHYYINEAWIEKLGLKMPTNVEELTDVFRAFKTQDPNGNGIADEIPMSASMSFQYFKNTAWLFGLPIMSTKNNVAYFYIDEDKQVQAYPVQDAFREYLEWMNLCYEEGLLDKEAISQDENTFKAKVATGNVGFFTEYRLTGSYAGSTVHDTHALWVPSSEETLMERSLSGASNRIFVSCTNEYVPQTMRWLDAQLETEMMAEIYLGEKDTANGWSYDAEGKIKDSKDTNVKTMDFLGVNGFLFGPVNYFMDNYNTEGAVLGKYTDCQTYEDAGLVQTYSNSYLTEVKFNTEELEKQTRIQADIDTAVKEYMASAIVNGVTDGSWNDFQKILEGIGINEMVELYQSGINNLDF